MSINFSLRGRIIHKHRCMHVCPFTDSWMCVRLLNYEFKISDTYMYCNSTSVSWVSDLCFDHDVSSTNLTQAQQVPGELPDVTHRPAGLVHLSVLEAAQSVPWGSGVRNDGRAWLACILGPFAVYGQDRCICAHRRWQWRGHTQRRKGLEEVIYGQVQEN